MYLEYLGGENLDSWVTLPNGRHQAVDEIITVDRFLGALDGSFPAGMKPIMNSISRSRFTMASMRRNCSLDVPQTIFWNRCCT